MWFIFLRFVLCLQLNSNSASPQAHCYRLTFTSISPLLNLPTYSSYVCRVYNKKETNFFASNHLPQERLSFYKGIPRFIDSTMPQRLFFRYKHTGRLFYLKVYDWNPCIIIRLTDAVSSSKVHSNFPVNHSWYKDIRPPTKKLIMVTHSYKLV